ncbi:MAG: hypothetical protein K9I85_11975 [Saprospiraceae bacterium]|nr:hypothetical protein [Saprospiraceae bacterium]
MKTLYIYPVLLILLVGACRSPQRFYEKGKYTKSVEEALTLVRKGKAEDKDIRTLELAFNQINTREISQLEKLLNSPSPDRWEELLTVAERIEQRQEWIKPYLPITYPRSGQPVSLRLYPLRDLIPQARIKAADRRIVLGEQALELAETGDKKAAREAYGHFTQSLFFRPGDAATRKLQDRAETLSYSLMRLQIDNQARAFLPGSFRLQLEQTFASSVDHRWLRILPDGAPCRDCDLETMIVLTDVNVSPDKVDERKWKERNTVEDGFRYALDERGNVRKDTNGNDIKIAVYKEVWAEVFETRQFKGARLEGIMEVRDLRSGRILRRIPVAAETQFLAESVWFQGDKRALDPKTVKQLKNHPIPFPDEQDILADAADLFREEVGRQARENRKLFML